MTKIIMLNVSLSLPSDIAKARHKAHLVVANSITRNQNMGVYNSIYIYIYKWYESVRDRKAITEALCWCCGWAAARVYKIIKFATVKKALPSTATVL